MMKKQFGKILAFIVIIVTIGLIPSVSAFELITREDIIQGIIVRSDLIKTADNAIIMFDSSSSMSKLYKNKDMSRYDIAKKTLIERNEYLPDLGHNIGLYLYTPWKEVYPMQKYDREKFSQALATLPEKATKATFLLQGLKRLDPILEELEGKTAIILFTDGAYTKNSSSKEKPSAVAQRLAEKYNVCFYLISTADDNSSIELFERAKEYNFCSRVIGFDDFIDRPEYNSEALFTVKATRSIVTVSEKKVVGIKTKNFLFGFDKSDLSQDVKKRLGLLALYLNDNKKAYAVLAGHTDNIGTNEYNMALSYRRVEGMTRYLVENHGVNKTQLAMFWFGQLNPIADNSTKEGRMLNRRVEIGIGGIAK